jgi:hypothetical protein
MLDRATMEKLDKQLKRITGNSTIYFGGMNVLFFGDFLQFPTVSHMDLYQAHPKHHSFGHELWRSLTTTVILEDQMRQSDDPVYGDLLRRVRLRQPSDDDIILLKSRIGAPLPTSCISPVVTRRHTVRKAINNVRLIEASLRSATPITYCIAEIIKAKKAHRNEIYNISYGDGRGTSKAKSDAILALVPGSPLMITANINVPLGTVTSFQLLFKISSPLRHELIAKVLLMGLLWNSVASQTMKTFHLGAQYPLHNICSSSYQVVEYRSQGYLQK